MSISQNKKDIDDDIEKALCHFYCSDSIDSLPHYAPGDFEIISVSKQQSEDRINEALKAGLTHFGENKVQEAISHWENIKADHSDLKIHLIGPLQSNKAQEAVRLFDVIHTVDREKIARALKKEMDKQGKEIPCYIQVNIGEEAQKSGIAPKDLELFYKTCVDEIGLNIVGLMCIPPREGLSGLYFSLLKTYADRIGVEGLSMGMSSDYQYAVCAGASYLRIGTKLMGER